MIPFKEGVKQNTGYFVFAAVLVLLDQIIKVSVKGFNLFGFEHSGLYYGQQIPVIGETIMITFIENPGMAFGIQFGAGKIFLSLFSVFASFALFWLITQLKNYKWGVRLGFSLILAGAFGNLIDRVFYGVFYGEMPLFYGKVVDWIQVDIPDVTVFGQYYTHFPIFNVADSCVTVGVIFLILFNKYLPEFHDLFPKKSNVDKLEPEVLSENQPNGNS
jgi:signal peptidase II